MPLYTVLLLAVALSMDAFAVAVASGCALITACGLYLGKSLARLCALNGWAELLGGLTLLAIACNILREHHVFD